MPLFMPMLSFGPYLAFLSPDMPPSVFEQLLSDTQGTVYLVLVFFSTPVSFVYFQVCSIHVYWCIFLLCRFYFCLTYSGRYCTFLFITHSLEIVLCLIFLHCIPFYAYAILLTSFLLMAI